MLLKHCRIGSRLAVLPAEFVVGGGGKLSHHNAGEGGKCLQCINFIKSRGCKS